MKSLLYLPLFWACLATQVIFGLDLRLPTANDALLHSGREVDFYQPSASGKLRSAMFGCVRNGGSRFHEGIDIRCLKRDRNGEPIDPVYAVAAGKIAYINTRSALSSYGRYIILSHRWDHVQVFTLYAHLRSVAGNLGVGQPVQKGQRIGTLGRSTNTKSVISKTHAHLHFEINFMLNPNFHMWYPKRDPDAPPFGNFNGQNFIGLDPSGLFHAWADNPGLKFRDYMADQPLGFSLLVRARPIPWLTLHPEQIQPWTDTSGDGIEPYAYEIAVTSVGLPIFLWPRTAEELGEAQRRSLQRPGKLTGVLNLVNDAELGGANCRGLVRQDPLNRQWKLTDRGREWLELLTFTHPQLSGMN